MRAGSTLLAAVLVTALMLVMGLAFLGKRALQYQTTERSLAAAQARALAQAGLEDVRVKLLKDYQFPPRNGDEQTLFVYTEPLTELGSARPLGHYTVAIDRTFSREPYGILRITVTGHLGPKDDPVARSQIYAEYDVAKKDHTNPSVDNPNLYEFILWRELTGL